MERTGMPAARRWKRMCEKMFVSSSQGDTDCIRLEEYKKLLCREMALPQGNEIWCAAGRQEEYPCLSILVQGEKAAVYYFSGEEMYVSRGERGEGGAAAFAGGKYEVQAGQLVTASAALECALEFFDSQKRPSCLSWEEL